jgi:hypothetical protein
MTDQPTREQRIRAILEEVAVEAARIDRGEASLSPDLRAESIQEAATRVARVATLDARRRGQS